MTNRGSKGREGMQGVPEFIEGEGLDMIFEVRARLVGVAFAEHPDLGGSHAEGASTMTEVGPTHLGAAPPAGVLLV